MKPVNSVLSGSVSGDPNPPVRANYAATDAVSNMWTSVVFHCGTPAVFCAKLEQLAGTGTSPAANQPALAARVQGSFTSTLTNPVTGAAGHFDLAVDGLGVGSYRWAFNLTGLSTTDTGPVANIRTSGLSCKLSIRIYCVGI